ncbi:neuropeptide S receptor-like [Babylonia areolata]|uniref:neuropeptide S receptor-like n=1 Tax=Babylonia areolata TaxID=304850 RepID=UPI003FD3F5C2
MGSITHPTLAIRPLVPETTSVHPVPGFESSLSYGISNASRNNGSQDHQEVEYWKDAQIGFLVMLMLTIVVGNSVVLSTITQSRKRRRTRMNFFIMHLAVCDLLTGPLVVLADLIQKLTTYWYAGDALCRIHKFTQVTVTYASTYMLVALSVDRLDAVARPMRFSSSRESLWWKAKVMVSTAWVLSVLFAIPELVLFRVGVQFGGPMCMIDFTEQWQWQAYLTPIAVTLFIIPAIIICICYVIIIAIIWRSSHILQRSNGFTHRDKHREQELLNGRYTPTRTPGPSGNNSRGVIPQAKIRTVKMTFIIVLVFIVCWSPYFLFNLCQVYGVVPETVPMMKASTFVQSMAPLNSAANPIIYGLFSTRICKYLRYRPDTLTLPLSLPPRKVRVECHDLLAGPLKVKFLGAGVLARERVYLCGRVARQVCQCRTSRGRGGGETAGGPGAGAGGQGRCRQSGSPPPTGSGSDESSMTEAEELHLSGSAGGDHRGRDPGGSAGGQGVVARVPYVKQKISEADRALLFMHIRTMSQEV